MHLVYMLALSDVDASFFCIKHLNEKVLINDTKQYSRFSLATRCPGAAYVS